MTLKCYDKPNRVKVRTFTENDLERIARIVHGDGVSIWKILASVALGVGSGFLVCKAAKSIRSVNSLLSIIKQIAFIGAVSITIRSAVTFLLRSPMARLPVINRFAVALVLILLLVQKGIDLMLTIVDDVVFLESIIDGLDTACEFVGVRVDNLRSKDLLDKLSEQDRLLAL